MGRISSSISCLGSCHCLNCDDNRNRPSNRSNACSSDSEFSLAPRSPTVENTGQAQSAMNTALLLLIHQCTSAGIRTRNLSVTSPALLPTSYPGSPAGTVGEISSPGLTLCSDSLNRCPFHPRVTAVARKRPRSFCKRCKWQVIPKHAYTLDPTKSEWADYAAVQA